MFAHILVLKKGGGWAEWVPHHPCTFLGCKRVSKRLGDMARQQEEEMNVIVITVTQKHICDLEAGDLFLKHRNGATTHFESALGLVLAFCV